MRAPPFLHPIIRLAAGFLVATLPALAAAQDNCAAISARLSSIESSVGYLDLAGAQQHVTLAQNRLADAEFQFDRAGCRAQLQTGGLDSICQIYSGAVLQARSDLDQLHRTLGGAQTLANEHQGLLAAYASQRCGSAVTFSGSAAERTTLLFDGENRSAPSSPGFVTDTVPDVGGARRTMCVRTCDGAYWPVSYSTGENDMAQDAQTCAQQCPGAPTALYSQANPGEDVSAMVSMDGVHYADQPFAFLFRGETVPACSCDLAGAGLMSVAASGPPATAPAPANLVDVPLPMPRPVFPGEEPPVAQMESEALRLYDFAGRQVRIVGPVTPYTPEGEGVL